MQSERPREAAPNGLQASDVARQLDAVAQRLIPLAVSGTDRASPLDLDLYTLVERSFPDEWQRDKSTALEVTLKCAIARLEGNFGAITRQEAALLLFNIEGAPPLPHVDQLTLEFIEGDRGKNQKQYGYLRERLMIAAGLTAYDGSSQRREIKRLRLSLAAILLDPKFPFTDSTDAFQDPILDGKIVDSDGQTFVTRAAELEWLISTYKSLAENGGVFQLWGVSGTGKTTLARQFMARFAPGEVGFVRLSQPGIFEEDISEILRNEGHESAVWRNSRDKLVIRSMTRQPRNIRLIVLDDARDAAEVAALVPPDSRIPVLVTGPERLRKIGDTSDHRIGVIARHLPSLSGVQAVKLLRHKLPDVKIEAAKALSLAVGGHPESLVHICHYLQLPDAQTTDDFLDELNREPREVLIGLTEIVDLPKCVVDAIENILEKLDVSSLSYDILMCLIWSTSTGQQPKNFLIDLVAELRGERPSPLAIDVAIKRLERLGLATLARTVVATSRLTCQILRDITIDSYESVLLAYERIVSDSSPVSLDNVLLDILRQDYVASPLQDPETDVLAMIGHEYDHACLLLGGFDLAMFITDHAGRRRAFMYRLTPKSIQGLMPGDRAWETFWVSDVENALKGREPAAIDSGELNLIVWKLAALSLKKNRRSRGWSG